VQLYLINGLQATKGESMTIANALNFIERAINDSGFRKRLNSASIESEISEILANEKFTFSKAEFNDSFLQRLTQCQETQEAEQLKEFRLWWGLLQKSLEPVTCSSACSGCKA
jgi:mannitol/fructose-specific phosphotransferase system IIA component (Ntr-type)